jgi:collagen type VII alpha
VTYGAVGPQGATGPVGPKGATGLTGATGLQGVKGATGVTGLTGAQGPQGLAGPTGATGVAGAAGLMGFPGPQGPAGAQGAQGEQGLAGATGVSGLQGVAGVSGPAGVSGEQGPTGSQGPAGVAGAAGAIGPQGIQGIPGETGAQGSQGLQGQIGSEGPQGTAGPMGPAGNLTWIGPWNTTTSYVAGNAVSFAGTSYMAVQNNTGQEPDISVGNPTVDYVSVTFGCNPLNSQFGGEFADCTAFPEAKMVGINTITFQIPPSPANPPNNGYGFFLEGVPALFNGTAVTLSATYYDMTVDGYNGNLLLQVFTPQGYGGQWMPVGLASPICSSSSCTASASLFTGSVTSPTMVVGSIPVVDGNLGVQGTGGTYPVTYNVMQPVNSAWTIIAQAGSQGAQGATGAAGTAGPQGLPGASFQGSTGPQGPVGATGPQGQVGPAFYSLSGTLADWLGPIGSTNQYGVYSNDYGILATDESGHASIPGVYAATSTLPGSGEYFANATIMWANTPNPMTQGVGAVNIECLFAPANGDTGNPSVTTNVYSGTIIPGGGYTTLTVAGIVAGGTTPSINCTASGAYQGLAFSWLGQFLVTYTPVASLTKF